MNWTPRATGEPGQHFQYTILLTKTNFQEQKNKQNYEHTVTKMFVHVLKKLEM